MGLNQEQQLSSSSSLLDILYCEEDRWKEEGAGENVEDEIYSQSSSGDGLKLSSFPLFLLDQDLFCEDQELLTLLSKEKQQTHLNQDKIDSDSSLLLARSEAVEWMLKVNAHYGFSALTAILAINYFDRFISSSFHFQEDKPWMIQLLAVTCLSLAAKVEETQVPLLLDFQVEETKFLFEAKTIQRMELLVLSTLQWRMNPVTPLSFVEHIIRRLGLKNHIHWDFLRLSEWHLLSIATDSGYVHYLPSVLAAATMMHIIDQVAPRNPTDHQTQLMGVLKISMEQVNQCYQELFMKSSSSSPSSSDTLMRQHKRRLSGIPSSPNGVIDACCLPSDNSSNDSWASPFGSSDPSSPEPPLKKRSRTHEQRMPFQSLNRVFVDLLSASPQ